MALLILATGGVVPLVAQTPTGTASGLSPESTAPADTTPTAAELRERWSEPFAVVSVGRPVPRPMRDVVLVGAPAPAAPTKPAAPAPAAQQSYTVNAGDTLWGIAHRFGVSMDALRKANGLKSDVVRLGETLTIPQGG